MNPLRLLIPLILTAMPVTAWAYSLSIFSGALSWTNPTSDPGLPLSSNGVTGGIAYAYENTLIKNKIFENSKSEMDYQLDYEFGGILLHSGYRLNDVHLGHNVLQLHALLHFTLPHDPSARTLFSIGAGPYYERVLGKIDTVVNVASTAVYPENANGWGFALSARMLLGFLPGSAIITDARYEMGQTNFSNDAGQSIKFNRFLLLLGIAAH